MSAAAVESRPTVRDGHLLLDHLVAAGLPQPARRKVRADLGELTLSLTLDDQGDFDAWRAELDTADAVPAGPWRIGPVSALVAIGRVRGVRAVLALEVEHDHQTPAEPAANPPAPAPQALHDSERTADHDTAGWRAAIEAAAGIAHRVNHRVTSGGDR